jgi:hypothetical protein
MGDFNKLISFFNKIDFQMDVDRFEDRLIAQKIACFIQLKGIDLRYPYNLYIRGPYSRLLAGDYYDHSEEFSDFTSNYRLNNEESQLITKLEGLFHKSPSILEIGATYGYLVTCINYTPINAYIEVKRHKKQFSGKKIAIGVSKAKEFLFEPSEDDINDLVQETESWQNAGLELIVDGHE